MPASYLTPPPTPTHTHTRTPTPTHHPLPLQIRLLGLDICADTVVGNRMLRGISGGQRKRVTTGEMVVGNVKAVFADEVGGGVRVYLHAGLPCPDACSFIDWFLLMLRRVCKGGSGGVVCLSAFCAVSFCF